MKSFKRTLTVVLAVAVMFALSSIAAFAAAGDKLDTAENTITATGVTAGDSVSYYQLVEWKDGNWALTTLGTTTGVSLANLIDGINETEATTIANALASATATGSMTAGDPATTFTASPVDAGLYYLKAVPSADNKDTVYNPAFVSADYFEGGNEISFNSTVGNSTVIKKSSVSLDKDVVGNDKFIDTKPGDVIPFKVTTTIPSYGTSFEHPKFEITDVLSEGLKLKQDTVSVKYGDNTATATNDDVEITKSDLGYTVKFKEAYLTGLNGATPNVEITYSAEVTTAASENVNPMDNTATLTFSNTPTTTKDKTDKTRHYTFSINGGLLGSDNDVTKELIKSGTDADGKPITTKNEYYNHKEAAPLSGAGFTLYSDADCTNNIATANSGGDGRITFNGLDAGTYYLKETSVPSGYVGDTRVFTVKITPTYSETEPDLLVSYTIEISAPAANDLPEVNGAATFTMTNEGGTTVSSSAGTDTSFINNTQGKGLPTTGGMGTKIFTIVGLALITGAAVMLIARRRMRTND